MFVGQTEWRHNISPSWSWKCVPFVESWRVILSISFLKLIWQLKCKINRKQTRRFCLLYNCYQLNWLCEARLAIIYISPLQFHWLGVSWIWKLHGFIIMQIKGEERSNAEGVTRQEITITTLTLSGAITNTFS